MHVAGLRLTRSFCAACSIGPLLNFFSSACRDDSFVASVMRLGASGMLTAMSSSASAVGDAGITAMPSVVEVFRSLSTVPATFASVS